MLIYENLRKFRISLDLSQEKLAEMCQVSRQSIAKWESGQTLPDISNIIKLSNVFNVSIEELVYGTISPIEAKNCTNEQSTILETIIDKALRNSILDPNPDNELGDFLNYICEQLNIAGVFIYKRRESEKDFSLIYDWCAKDAILTKPSCENIPEADIQPSLTVIKNIGSMIINDIADIKERQPLFSEHLLSMNVKSAILLPMKDLKHLVIAVNPPSMFIQQVNTILKVVVEFLESMLSRRNYIHRISLDGNFKQIQNDCYIAYSMDFKSLEFSVEDPHNCELGNLFEGISPEEKQELVKTRFANISPDFYRLLNKTIATKQASQAEMVTFNFEGHSKDLQVDLYPILDWHRNVIQVYGTISFPTCKNLSECELRNILANTPGGMHVCHLGDNPYLETVNLGLCSMLGYSKEEFDARIGTRYANAIVEEDRPIFHNYIVELSENPGVSSCIYRMICKDGSIIKVIDTMKSVKSDNGTISGYANVLKID